MAKINQLNISESSSLKEISVDKEIESQIEQLNYFKNYWKAFQ